MARALQQNKQDKLDRLREEVLACTACQLHKTRTNVVFVEGSPDAKLMFIGEATGYWEDQQGRPFVGSAGKVLDKLLASIGLSRSEVYIANVLKCRPPKNREPRPEEINACTPYLDSQMAIIRPRMICTLGNYSTSYVLGKFGIKAGSMSSVHGRVYRCSSLLLGEVLVIPTYHPATVLYKPYMMDTIKKDWEVIESVYKSL